jgi:hypothetical protein
MQAVSLVLRRASAVGQVRLASIAPAFRFEIIQALRLLISDQSMNAQIVRSNQREFVDRWYDRFAPIRADIDAAMAPGSYSLCWFLLTAEDTVPGMLAHLRRVSDRVSAGTVEGVPTFVNTDRATWSRAVDALEKVLPEFHAQCFRQEWERWQPIIEESAARMRQVAAEVDIFGAVERFTGRDYGRLEAAVYPSKWVRPSNFVIHREDRMAMVLQHQTDEIWFLTGLVHESGHVLFRNPDWFEACALTEDDMAWVEALLPDDWRDTGCWTARQYLEETFLDALAFGIVGRLLPDQQASVCERAMENFRNRSLVLGPSIYEATAAEYQPGTSARYDDFVASLVRDRKLRPMLDS